jgi:TolB protein
MNERVKKKFAQTGRKDKWLLFCAGLIACVYSPARWAGEVAFLAYTETYWQVWCMNADGSGQRQVTRSPYDKHHISWYPDGGHLLVNGLQGELIRVQIANGQETPVDLPLRGTDDAVLSPDGHYIAFSISTGDSRDINNIWVVNSDGSDPRKLTHLNNLQHQPSWSADGEVLYFAAGDGGQSHDLWQLRIDSHKLEQLTSGNLYHFDVVASREGRLAFSSNRSGDYEIWVQEVGQEALRITDAPGLDAQPTWSPDGDSLIFVSTRSGNVPNLWRVRLPNGQPVQLTDFPKGARSPAWRWSVEDAPS